MALSVPVTPLTSEAASTTWRHYRLALGAALGAALFGCSLYGLEKYAFRLDRRFVENPVDVMMRALGVGHFLVGWLFLFTSPRLRNWPAVGRLTGWTALGALLCWFFFQAGAGKNPFALMAFYSFFLVHDIRDQTALFQTYGDAPPPSPLLTRFLHLFSLAFILLLMTILIGMHLFQGHYLEKVPTLTALPTEGVLAGWALLLLSGLLLAGLAARRGRALFGTWDRAATALRPLLAVYGATFALVVVGSFFGSVGLNLIILIHVTTWLVFVTYQLRKSPVRPDNLWTWLRRTPAGFLCLHLGLTAVVLVLMALRVYCWGRTGWLSVCLAGSSFPYWSLLHIAMAFWNGHTSPKR